MLREQDARAVEAMVRCNMEIEELCDMFPAFNKEDIQQVIEEVKNESVVDVSDMHSVSVNCS